MVGVLDGDGVYRFLAVATLDVPTGVVFLGLVPGDADSACVQGVAPPIGLVLSEAGGSIEESMSNTFRSATRSEALSKFESLVKYVVLLWIP